MLIQSKRKTQQANIPFSELRQPHHIWRQLPAAAIQAP
jgi:hypothetical protein